MRRPGTYVPLSAHYADDEKIMEVGEDAELMYVRMLAYAARTPRTGGWISDAVAMSRLGIIERPEIPGSDPGTRLGKLAGVGLIIREGSGWRIAAWHRWNRSPEQIDRERAQDRTRKSRANTGKGTGTASGSSTGIQGAFLGADTDTDTDTEERGKRRKRPARAELPEQFLIFWDLYPKKRSRGAALKAWKQAVRKEDPSVIIDGLRSQLPWFASQVRADGDYRPSAGPWLNGERWTDEAEAPQATRDDDNPWAHLPTDQDLVDRRGF